MRKPALLVACLLVLAPLLASSGVCQPKRDMPEYEGEMGDRARLEELFVQLDADDPIPEVYRQLASPVLNEFREEILSRLEVELADNSQNIAASYCYYHLLQATRRYEAAAEAAWGVYSAVCGDRHRPRCGNAEDELFLRSFSLQLEAKARASRLTDGADAASTVLELKPLWQEAVRLADQLEPTYVPPESLVNAIPLYVGFAPPILARSSWAAALIEAGQLEEALEVMRDADQICPAYHPVEFCEQIREKAEERLNIE